MEALFPYIVKVNISLIFFYLLYALLFREDTFIYVRRFYFLGVLIFSLIYPLFTISGFNIPMPFQSKQANGAGEIMIGQLFAEALATEVVETTKPTRLITLLLSWIILIGNFALTLRFIKQLISIIKLRLQSKQIVIDGITVYNLTMEKTPFSFANWIFIQTSAHSEEELKQILCHELTHVNQKHTIDVLIFEFTSILFWYNPIIWLQKQEVRTNLEYLADNSVLQQGINSKQYQYNLLNLTYPEANLNLTNNFNVPQLKQRIKMMNNQKTPMGKLVKYLSILPIALLLVAINSTHAKANEQKIEIETITHLDTTNLFADNDTVFNAVHEQPEYSGGINEMMKYLSMSIKYPIEAQEKNIQGRVIVTFVVNKDGSISDTKIVDGIDELLDNEAIRVVNAMPKWKPGKHNNELVRVRYTLRILFNIPQKDDKSEKVKSQSDTDKALIIVHGMKKETSNDLDQIDPKSIESISVLKDKNSLKEYGADGKDGVVLIKTKDNNSNSLNIRNEENIANLKNIVIIIDGLKMSEDYDLNQIDPANIESISVIKDKAKLKELDAEGKDGVIIISTKKSK